MTSVQIQRLVRRILDEMKKSDQVTFKETEEKVFKRAVAIVQQDFDREAELDKQVNLMLDDLERKNPGEFQRFKMFPMLKKRLAKEKGVVL